MLSFLNVLNSHCDIPWRDDSCTLEGRESLDCHVELRALGHRNHLGRHSAWNEQSRPFDLLLDLEYVSPSLTNSLAKILTDVSPLTSLGYRPLRHLPLVGRNVDIRPHEAHHRQRRGLDCLLCG